MDKDSYKDLDPETGECPPEHTCQTCLVHYASNGSCLCTLKRELFHAKITLLLTHGAFFVFGLIIGNLIWYAQVR